MIVWTNGCFDVIHAGHIELFKYARSLGDYLVVGVDEDERVKLNKGPTRPINSLNDRVNVLESIRYIDKVVTFGSDQELIQHLASENVDLMIIGSDYVGKKVVGSEKVDVRFFSRIPEKSSTRLIDALRV